MGPVDKLIVTTCSVALVQRQLLYSDQLSVSLTKRIAAALQGQIRV